MVRTKYLLVAIGLSVIAIFSFGIWSSTEQTRISPKNIQKQEEIFFVTPQDSYSVDVKRIDSDVEKRESFISKVRSAFLTESIDRATQTPSPNGGAEIESDYPSVLESVKESATTTHVEDEAIEST